MQYNDVRIFKIAQNKSKSSQKPNSTTDIQNDKNGFKNLNSETPDQPGRLLNKYQNSTSPYACIQISEAKYIEVLCSELVSELLSGRSCIVLGLGPHGSGKSSSMFGQHGLLEHFLGKLLNQTKGSYSVALSLFELQGKVILDHLAPENAFQSHFASPSILSCKIASKRDFLLLLHHMQAISQNFDNFTAIPNKANGFARAVCYNYQTKAIVTILFVDIMGDPSNYGEVIAQLPNCLLPSERTFVNMEFQTPLIQFITPIMKISKVYLLDFNQNTKEDETVNNFYTQMSQYKSKQIPMRIEIKDWITIGIDDVQCEQIDLSSLLSSQQSLHTDNMQKTLSPEVALAKSESVMDDLYHSESTMHKSQQMNQVINQEEQLDDQEGIEDLYETDNDKINTVEQLDVKAVNPYLQQRTENQQEQKQQRPNSINQQNKSAQKVVSFNQTTMKTSQLSEANLTKSDLNYGKQQNVFQSSQYPSRQYIQQNISSTQQQPIYGHAKHKKVNFFTQNNKNEDSEESIPNQLTVSKIPAHSILPNKLSEITNLQQATQRLKETEYVRSDLESKIRLIEAQGAELKIKTELNRINNELRIKLLENLDNGGLENHEKTLDRLSNQICDQIQANIDLLQSKCSKMTKVPGVQSLLAKFRQEQLEAINKQKQIHQLMQCQRQYIKNEVDIENLKREVNSKLIQHQRNQEILDEQQNEIIALNKQILEYEQKVKEKQNKLEKHQTQCQDIQKQLEQIKKLTNDLGQLPKNMQEYETKIKTLLDYLNKLAKQRMLSHQEIKMRNICSNLKDLCAKKLQISDESDVLKEFKQEIFNKEKEAEDILLKLLNRETNQQDTE